MVRNVRQQPRPSHVSLTKSEARSIFQRKLHFLKIFIETLGIPAHKVNLRGLSAQVAAEFGTSQKVVRDIWNHKTWRKTTRHLWGLDSEFDISSSSEIPDQSSPNAVHKDTENNDFPGQDLNEHSSIVDDIWTSSDSILASISTTSDLDSF